MIRRLSLAQFLGYFANFERAVMNMDLLVMKQLNAPIEIKQAAAVVHYLEPLSGMISMCDQVYLAPAVTAQLRRLLDRVKEENERWERASEVLKQSGDIRKAFPDDAAHFAAIAAQARIARTSVIDDLSQHFFLCVSAADKELLDPSEPLFGESVNSICPEATRDINAAARCLALDEWTACVFHLMRVLEQGLHIFVKFVDLPSPDPSDAENWKNILDRAEKKIRELEALPKSPEKMKKTDCVCRGGSSVSIFQGRLAQPCFSWARALRREGCATNLPTCR